MLWLPNRLSSRLILVRLIKYNCLLLFILTIDGAVDIVQRAVIEVAGVGVVRVVPS